MSPRPRPARTKLDLILLFAFVLAIRLPFLTQAIGGDDVYYLAAAYHGLVDPLHPNHIWYVFGGRDVTFQGYPHPPGNAWFLCGLLAMVGDVHEVVFHAAYVVFSLLAVFGMYALARRFAQRPLAATLLCGVVPPFVVNGNLLESDVPLLSFWLAGAAAFVYGVDRKDWRLLAASGLGLAVAGLIAMQSVLFTPILLAYLWFRRERAWRYIALATTPILTLAAWQLFERATSGVFPAAISAGYLTSYGYERIPMKLRNALALAIHFCFLVLPMLLPFAAVRVWRDRRDGDTRFLMLWILIFFAGACALFYSGSARYLLPLAAPVAILLSRAPANWVRAAIGIQLAISLGLATVNFEHWNGYRQFARDMRAQTAGKRVWVDAEWGLRHYFEAAGALPLHRDQWIPTGDIVVESELAFPAPYAHGGRALVEVARTEIRPWIPLRLIGLEARSGYSTNSLGLLPYDVRGGVVDRVRAVTLRAQEPTLSILPMSAPEVDSQVLYGIYPAEGQPWRWTAEDAALLLKSPGRPATLELKIYIADAAPARVVHVRVEGGPETTKTLPGPGSYTVSLPVDTTGLSTVTVRLSVDRTFTPAGDSRRLGIILNEAGLR